MKKINVYNKKDFNLNGFNFSLNLFFEHNLTKIEGDVYYHKPASDDYLHSRGIVLAAAVAMDFNGVRKNVVLHDSSFDKVPNYVKKFFVAHEAGHIMNGDLENMTESLSKKLVIQRMLGILPKMEIMADRYASSLVGKEVAKKSLMFMIRNTNLPLTTKLELLKRYFLI